MDMSQTFAGEEVLVICNRFSNYTWMGKTGEAAKVQSTDVIRILIRWLGTELLMVKKAICENATNLQ